ncbi:putative quinol monooxygenase [Haloarchaeobius sp. HME9146]|uniref:putative quinol monooxygenase n=1 Tax=Haloarchaeobius sp. HME9146 TaxID=2978732 RepID=UPI0021C03B10|nr:putative quinol monooxygenase [Haloarchaeobius sp. HME9146]MCT9096036.1 antibiotic biosynthesis monooxygenase [Haloarchaeobius sp. HME9146]
MLVIHAVFPIDPDRRDEALEQFQTLAEQSRAEEGAIDYRVTTNIERPNEIRVFEQYEDEAAFGAHAESDHFKKLEAALPDLLAGEPSVTRFDVDSATELEV